MKSSIFVMILCGVSFMGGTACTQQEVAQVVSDISPVGACIAGIVSAANGVEDPTLIASSCTAAVADVYQVVSELLAHDPTAAGDASAVVLEDAVSKRTHLTNIQAAALTVMKAAGTPIPTIQ